jgi:hypothetical protein
MIYTRGHKSEGGKDSAPAVNTQKSALVSGFSGFKYMSNWQADSAGRFSPLYLPFMMQQIS